MVLKNKIENNKLLKSMIDSFPEMVFIFDSSKSIVYVNKVVNGFLKKNHDKVFIESKHGELLNCSYLSMEKGCGLGPFCHDCMMRETVEKVYTEGLPVVNKEGIMNLKIAGEERKVHVILSAHSFQEEEEIYVMLIIKNIDELKEIEKEKIKNLEKLSIIGSAASSIVHDIRNPLTGIIGYIYLLEKRYKDEKNRKIFQKLNEGIKKMKSMLEEILDIATGKEEMDLLLEEMQYNEFIEDIVEDTSVNTVIKLDLRYNGKINFDEGKIYQAVWNLIKNADEAIDDEEGLIKISIYEEGKYIVTKISDTGKGIAEEAKENLFKAGKTFGKSNGKGFGLFSVKKIVEAHGGEIHFNSKVGEGTSFYIKLPK